MAFAPWTVDQIYEFLRWLLRKNQAGAISATNFFYSWNSESSSYFKDLLGRFQARSNGKLGVNTGLVENETIESQLSPFTKTVNLPVVAGFATKPSDCIYKIGMRFNDQPVFHVNKNRIASVLNSTIDAPSLLTQTYYHTPYGNTYKVYPAGISDIYLDYISHPIDIVWAYTIVSNRQVYDAGSSVQPQWLQTEIVEITKRSLKSFGVSFHDNDFSQFGNSVINTGN
jgi:hypothetical protein